MPFTRVVIHTVKLSQCLPLHHKQTSPLLQSNIVYQYECPQCHSTYIGQTHRHLLTRFNEHSKSYLFTHHSSCSNQVDFKTCFTVIANCHSSYYLDLLILEALFIKLHKPAINRQQQTISMLTHLPM